MFLLLHALPLGQKQRAARLHEQRPEVQLLSRVSHRPAALGDDYLVKKTVLAQQLLAEDAVAVFHQPLAQRLFTAIGLQDQTLLTAEYCLAVFEDIADRLAPHSADSDDSDGVLGFDRCQTIGQAHSDVFTQAIFTHGAGGRMERRQRHLACYGCHDGAAAHQSHWQIRVIGTYVPQTPARRDVRRHALQAHGQCVFIQTMLPFDHDCPIPRAFISGRHDAWRGLQGKAVKRVEVRLECLISVFALKPGIEVKRFGRSECRKPERRFPVVHMRNQARERRSRIVS